MVEAISGYNYVLASPIVRCWHTLIDDMSHGFKAWVPAISCFEEKVTYV